MASQVLGRLADRFENLLKARDLLLRLAAMLLKRAFSSSDCAAFAIFGNAPRIFFSAK